MNDLTKVSIKQFIISACEGTETNYLREMPLLLKWAKYADMSIQPKSRYKTKIFVDTIENCKISLPCEAIYVEDVMLGDHGCDCDTQFTTYGNWFTNCSEITSGDDCFVFNWTDDSYYLTDINWQVKGDCIEFSGLNDHTVTYKCLIYELDDEGIPIVYFCHGDAIEYYIRFKLLERSQWKLLQAGRGTGPLNEAMKLTKMHYHRGVRKAKGIHNMSNSSQIAEIGDIISDPLSGRKMPLIESLY